MDFLSTLSDALHDHSKKKKKPRKVQEAEVMAWLVAVSMPKFIAANVAMYTLGILFTIAFWPLGVPWLIYTFVIMMKALNYR